MNHSKMNHTTKDFGANPFKTFEMRETEFSTHLKDLDKPFASLSNKVKLLKKLPMSSSKNINLLKEKYA